MKKPSTYTLLKAAIENGYIDSVREIQKFVSITVLTRDICLNYNTLSKRLLYPQQLTVGDVYRLAFLIGVDPERLYKWVSKQINVKDLRGKVAR
jgi:hypothetical protein